MTISGRRLALVVFSSSLCICGWRAQGRVLSGEDARQPMVNLGKKEGLPSAPMNSMAELADGTMAFGTANGLALWKDGKLRVFTGPYFECLDGGMGRMKPGNSALPSNCIQALLVARDGVLWIGTSKGLVQLKNGTLTDVSPKLPPTWPAASSQQSAQPAAEFPADCHDVYSLYEAKDGRIFIGTRNAGILAYHPKEDCFELLHSLPDVNKWIWAIDEDKQGVVWFAARGLGVLRLAEGKVSLLPQPEGWVPVSEVRSLCVDRKGALWVGTANGLGVSVADGSRRAFKDKETLPDLLVKTLRTGSDGRIWAFTHKGAAVFNGERWAYPEIDGKREIDFAFEMRSGDLWTADWQGATRNASIQWNAEIQWKRRLGQAKV